MRRLLAIALSFALGSPLIPAGFAAPAETKVPACCRRDGKHGCSKMSGLPDDGGKSAGTRIKATKSPCPSFPKNVATAAGPVVALTAARTAIGEPAKSSAIRTAQTEARGRRPFEPGLPKRGPPTSIS